MKRIWSRIQGSIYGRFMISFTMVLILPSLFYSFFYLNYFQKIVEEHVISQTQSSLDLVAKELTRYEEELRAVSLQNSNLNITTPAYLKKDQNGRELCSQLLAETSTHTYIDQIIYYNTGVPGRIYCCQGTFTPDYFEQYMGTGKRDFSFPEYLEQLKKHGWFLYEQDSSTGELGVMFSFQVRNIGYKNYWIYHLDGGVLKELLEMEESTTVLYDKEGNQIYPYIPVEEQSISDDDYVMVERTEDSFSLVRFFSRDTVFAQVKQTRNLFLIISLLVLAAGGCLVTWLSLYNKKPIDELKMYCESKCKELPEALGGFEIFRFALDQMEERIALLDKKRREERLLFRLIYEKPHPGENLSKEIQEVGILKQSEIWAVLLVEFHGEASTEIQNIPLLSMLLGEQYELYLTDEAGKDILIGILGMQQEDAENLQCYLQEIARRISEKSGQSIHFYVGGRCRKEEEIHWSYRQALRLLHNKQEDINWSVMCEERSAFKESEAEENKTKCTDFLYPDLELNSLYNALDEADYHKMSLVTEVLLEMILDNREDYQTYVPLCYDILYIFDEAKEGMNVDSGELKELLNRRNWHTMNQAEEFTAYIRKVYEKFAVILEQGDAVQGPDNLAVQIISFIDQNVRNPEISVNYVADKFQMSISNLSHQFKALTNRNISDYITEKKFSYVNELLLETDYTIQEISRMIGYSQAASFNYRFKKYFGMTPGEYREKYKKKNIE